jgi:hypothetical protein
MSKFSSENQMLFFAYEIEHDASDTDWIDYLSWEIPCDPESEIINT